MRRDEPSIELRPVPSVHGGAFVVALIGDHDLATKPLLIDGLAGLPPEATVILDLTRCTFIDSTVIGAILGHRLPDRPPVALVLPPDTSYVVRALSVIGVRDLLPVHASVAAALKCLDGTRPDAQLGT